MYLFIIYGTHGICPMEYMYLIGIYMVYIYTIYGIYMYLMVYIWYGFIIYGIYKWDNGFFHY